jgi:hypothetical protein
MKSLTQILKLFREEPSGRPAAGVRALDKEALRKMVARERDKNVVWFIMAVAMVFILFIVEIVLIILDPSRAAGVSSAFGASAVALIGTMIYLWKEKCKKDLFLELIEFMDKDTLQNVITSLVGKKRNQNEKANPLEVRP